MNFDKIIRKECYPWGERKIIFLNRFKYRYISQIKRQYRDLIGSLNGLAKLVDIKTLNPASGQLRDFQLELAALAHDVQEKMRAVDLHPFLIAGSLIGCLRHNGFIPWDDDIDFALIRDEYERLYEFLSEHATNINENNIKCKNRKYLLESLDRALKKSNGKLLFLRTQTHIKVLKGTSLAKSTAIDFFSLDYINESTTIEEYKKNVVKLIRKRKSGKNINAAVKSICDFANASDIFSKKPTSRVYYGFDNLDATKREHIKFFNASDVFPLQEAKFEDYNFLVPSHPEDFLYTMLNSDFMSVPTDIGLSHHVIEFQEFESSQ